MGTTKALLHDRTGEQADHIQRTFTRATTSGLASLEGQRIAGTWRLRVSDRDAIDVGKRNRWQLTLKPA